jgi:hypothetical protein
MGVGDELLAAGRAEALWRINRRRVKILDRNDRPRWHPVWNGNPALAMPEEEGEFELLKDCGHFRPYMRDIADTQYRFTAYRPRWASLYFTDSEMAFGAANVGHVILEPNLKPRAPRNKDWGWPRWERLAWLLADLPLAQVGPLGTKTLQGVPLIETPDFRMAAAVLKFSRVYVGHEGGLHHAAAAVRLPAVVIFGGFISPAVTGYAEQTSLTAQGLGVEHPYGCGRRVECPHCADAMAQITPERVADEVRKVLES